MPIPERPRQTTDFPGLEWELTDDGSKTLWSSEINEGFHSGCGAASESLVVYLGNALVAERITQRQDTSVLEIGFGTGTAFLLTAALAEMLEVPLRYTAFESHLLAPSLFRALDLADQIKPRMLSQVNALAGVDAGRFAERVGDLTSQLADAVNWARQPTSPVRLRIGRQVGLELYLADLRKHLQDTLTAFDAVYFDPFSPEVCPELWRDDIFQFAHRHLTPNGCLTSYCVKGSVRRGLQNAGFQCQRLPGPVGGKREVLRATPRITESNP